MTANGKITVKNTKNAEDAYILVLELKFYYSARDNYENYKPFHD